MISHLELLDEKILAALDAEPNGLTANAIGAAVFGNADSETRNRNLAAIKRRLDRLDARGLIEERKDWTTVYLTLDPKARARWAAEADEVEARASRVLATAQRLGHAPATDEPERLRHRFGASTVTITASQYLDLAERAERRSGAAAEPGSWQCKYPHELDRWFRSRVDVDALDVEYFWVITLDARQRPIGLHEVHKGWLSGVQTHPREIFTVAIRDRAHSMIVLHNHPSGDAEPSEADIEMTRRLVSCGLLLGIPVIDHLVITRSTYCSLASRGMMQADDD